MPAHNVAQVQLDDTTFNLREKAQRDNFISQATISELSIIQSHLLISDGHLDLRELPDQPRFRRRILFSTETGDIGIFDTSPDALTLFEAAIALEALARPVMALNLDMGAYDYCARNDGGNLGNCGLLSRRKTEILTNVLTVRLHTQE